MARKKVGGVRGGNKTAPDRRKKRKVGGVARKPMRATLDCGCVVDYDECYNGIGLGKPKYIKPCKAHEIYIPQWNADKLQRKLGGVVPGQPRGTKVGHRQCLHCTGHHIHGNWVHDSDCPYVAVLWDFDDSSWRCPYGCDGVWLGSCQTHTWDCQFWNDFENEVPF